MTIMTWYEFLAPLALLAMALGGALYMRREGRRLKDRIVAENDGDHVLPQAAE